MNDPRELAEKILAPLFNPEPHPFQEEWSDAHSMSSEDLVTRLAKALESFGQERFEEGLSEAEIAVAKEHDKYLKRKLIPEARATLYSVKVIKFLKGRK